MLDEFHIPEDDLNEYLDGLAGPAKRTALESHLQNCELCSARLAELRAVFQALDELPEAALERDFKPEILRAIGSLDTNIQTMLYSSHKKSAPPFATFMIFTAQVIGAVALSIFAAPSVASLIQRFALQQYIGQMELTLVILLQNRLASWHKSWQPVQAALESLKQALSQAGQLPGWIQGSVLDVVVFLAVATLFWIVLNAWLLSKRKPESHISFLL